MNLNFRFNGQFFLNNLKMKLFYGYQFFPLDACTKYGLWLLLKSESLVCTVHSVHQILYSSAFARIPLNV